MSGPDSISLRWRHLRTIPERHHASMVGMAGRKQVAQVVCSAPIEITVTCGAERTEVKTTNIAAAQEMAEMIYNLMRRARRAGA